MSLFRPLIPIRNLSFARHSIEGSILKFHISVGTDSVPLPCPSSIGTVTSSASQPRSTSVLYLGWASSWSIEGTEGKTRAKWELICWLFHLSRSSTVGRDITRVRGGPPGRDCGGRCHTHLSTRTSHRLQHFYGITFLSIIQINRQKLITAVLPLSPAILTQKSTWPSTPSVLTWRGEILPPSGHMQAFAMQRVQLETVQRDKTRNSSVNQEQLDFPSLSFGSFFGNHPVAQPSIPLLSWVRSECNNSLRQFVATTGCSSNFCSWTSRFITTMQRDVHGSPYSSHFSVERKSIPVPYEIGIVSI